MRIRGARNRREEEAVTTCLRGRCNGMAFDTDNRIITVQASALGGDDSSDDPALKPQVKDGMPVVFPYGFVSLMPAGDAYEAEILTTAAGVICVGTRSALPSGIPTPEEGDSIVHSSGGSYMHHDADGDTVIEPNDGSVVKAGEGATDFVALAALVKAELTSIATALSTHTHSGVTSGTSSTGTSSSGYTADDVKATKLKAE